MPYRVHVPAEVRQVIRDWHLDPDELLVDVELHLAKLREDPARLLKRVAQPVDGMVYEFWVTDPQGRSRLHNFIFHVRYGDDEETLWILRGYVCTDLS